MGGKRGVHRRQQVGAFGFQRIQIFGRGFAVRARVADEIRYKPRGAHPPALRLASKRGGVCAGKRARQAHNAHARVERGRFGKPQGNQARNRGGARVRVQARHFRQRGARGVRRKEREREERGARGIVEQMERAIKHALGGVALPARQLVEHAARLARLCDLRDDPFHHERVRARGCDDGRNVQPGKRVAARRKRDQLADKLARLRVAHRVQLDVVRAPVRDHRPRCNERGARRVRQKFDNRFLFRLRNRLEIIQHQ